MQLGPDSWLSILENPAFPKGIKGLKPWYKILRAIIGVTTGFNHSSVPFSGIQINTDLERTNFCRLYQLIFKIWPRVDRAIPKKPNNVYLQNR